MGDAEYVNRSLVIDTSSNPFPIFSNDFFGELMIVGLSTAMFALFFYLLLDGGIFRGDKGRVGVIQAPVGPTINIPLSNLDLESPAKFLEKIQDELLLRTRTRRQR